METNKSNNKHEGADSNEFQGCNTKLHNIGVNLREPNKLCSIISQSDSDSLNDTLNSEFKALKPNDRFVPYPIHRQLFMRQQHEQERRRRFMVNSSSRLPSPCRNFYDQRMSNQKVLNRIKIITFIDNYSIRLCSNQCDCNDKCVVCMHNYRENEQLRKLQCNHKFHRKCVDEWLIKSYLCPVCRTPLTGSGETNKNFIDNNNINQVYENEHILTSSLSEPAPSSKNENKDL